MQLALYLLPSYFLVQYFNELHPHHFLQLLKHSKRNFLLGGLLLSVFGLSSTYSRLLITLAAIRMLHMSI